jgi:hypothetical protein
VQHFKLLDRHRLGDTAPTLERCALLLRRVLAHVAGQQLPLLPSSGGMEYNLRGRPSG